MFGKDAPYRNKKILDYAKGQHCQINIHGICNHNNETVVACHIRKHEFGAGVGLKPDDCVIFFACSACHDVCDGRVSHEFDSEWLYSQMHEANTRTMRILFREGIVK